MFLCPRGKWIKKLRNEKQYENNEKEHGFGIGY
jgi:hypothetical protein